MRLDSTSICREVQTNLSIYDEEEKIGEQESKKINELQCSRTTYYIQEADVYKGFETHSLEQDRLEESNLTNAYKHS